MSTLITTLKNTQRGIPFMMWWMDIMLMGFIHVVEGLVRLVSLGFIIPNWQMKFLSWSMLRQIEYRRAHSKD